MSDKALVVQEAIESKIILIRGKRVMLDFELANMYGVTTARLNEQVKRNLKRFPDSFMFQLLKEEFDSLMSQIAISKKGRGGRRKLPFVFTEYGAVMLASILNSSLAITTSIYVVEAFIKLREFAFSNKEIAQKMLSLEQDVCKNKENIKSVFNVVNQLISPEKYAVFTLSKTKMKAVNQEIQEALGDLNRRPKPDITGAIQHATAAVECVLRNITGEHNLTLGQMLKKRKDIIPPPLNISVEKAWGYASDKARHVREGAVLDHCEAEFVVTQFISVANFLVKKFKGK